MPFAELASLERSFAHVREAAARVDPDRPLEEQDVADLDITPAEFFARADLGPHTRDLWRARVADVAGDDWDVPSVLPLLAGVAASGGSVLAAAFIDAPVDTPVARAMGPQLRHGTRALHAAVLGESSADILLGARVTAVRDGADAVAIESAAGPIEAGAVIMAVPLSVVADIAFDPPLPPEHAEIARTGVAGGAEKLTALVTKCPKPFLAYGFPPGGGLVAAAVTAHEGDRASVVAFTTHRGALDPNDAEAVQAALRVYCPEIVVEASTGHDWPATRTRAAPGATTGPVRSSACRGSTGRTAAWCSRVRTTTGAWAWRAPWPRGWRQPGIISTMPSELTALLRDLVAIDSVNPVLVEGGAGETEIAAFVAAWGRAAGLEAEVLEASPGRPSVLLRAQGGGGGRTLLLCAHLDTVGVDGMEAPHAPRIEGDRLHGAARTT